MAKPNFHTPTRRILAALAVSLGALLGASCCCKSAKCPSPPPTTDCALGSPPAGAPGFPRLYRSLLNAPSNARYDTAPVCAKPHAVSDECELVDDAQTLLGTGYECVMNAEKAIGACSGWSATSALLPAPRTPPAFAPDPPCGDSACPNVFFDARDPSGKNVRVTFYDDISCHQAAVSPSCPRTRRDCYYRILRVDSI